MTGKKKSKSFIIPATAFREIIPVIQKKSISQQVIEEKNIVAEETPPIKVEKKATEKITSNVKRGDSALSLKNLKSRLSSDEENKGNQEKGVDKNLPKTPFDIIKANKAWNKYVDYLLQQGKKSLASIMKMNDIEVKENEIHLVLPNVLVESQLKMSQTPLLEFLKKELNNFYITIHTKVNEEKSKNLVYTPQEKYEKLKEKNSHIELLKKTFFLDV